MSTNGLVQPHFIPAAHDHGMPVTTAAGLLAVVGLFDIAGTIFSGWLTDRVDPRVLLLAYYGLRGLSLFALPTLFGPRSEEHTSELQSRQYLVCRLLLEKKKNLEFTHIC